MVADTLSRLVEEVSICKEDIVGFETIEFESREYKDLIDTIKENIDKFPDMKVINGMVFKRNRLDSDLQY